MKIINIVFVRNGTLRRYPSGFDIIGVTFKAVLVAAMPVVADGEPEDEDEGENERLLFVRQVSE